MRTVLVKAKNLAAEYFYCKNDLRLRDPQSRRFGINLPHSTVSYTTTTWKRILPYAMPAQLVDIRGRRINLHCMGAGGPAFILMAGIFGWSVAWYKTQPEIAQTARVCAFDRAGHGFSDPGPRPQIVSDAVDDPHTALKAGDVPGPYVLVAT